MADVKTHLRELSVAIGLRGHSEDLANNITPLEFKKNIEDIISNNISNFDNYSQSSSFNSELKSIIRNGIQLGNKIVELKLVNPNNQIIWTGSDTQKNDPIDLYVGGIGLSLKEDSFILENMGLYKYINLLTNSNFQRGLHVFEHFAPKQYNEWFFYTWNLLINQTSQRPWLYKNKDKYTSEIHVKNSKVYFIKDTDVLSTLPAKLNSIQDFTNLTTSVSREKVFAKWIKKEINNHTGYLQTKNTCSVVAGENLVNFVNSKLDPKNISRLLQIYKNDYYYAKTTSNSIEIFHVPNQQGFLHDIRVHKVSYSVPASQLNIHTTIENLTNGEILVFRNECRFSHGQFNGTPEAKMYYERGNDLSVIYNRIV